MNEQMKQEAAKKDQETVQKLLPAWRKILIDAHSIGSKAVAFLLTPVTWVMEHLDGTADWRAMETRLDEAEHKKHLAPPQAV